MLRAGDGVEPSNQKITEHRPERRAVFFSKVPQREMQHRRTRGLLRVVERFCLAGILSVAVVSVAATERLPLDARESIRRYKTMSLDELLDQQVVTVSRSEQHVSNTAAAIQVIGAEEIRRSSATTLPEALRLASNLAVARASSSSWAISARGFNNELANKMLVLIDGRTVYTPLYAGVFWDTQNVLLEDVDRIEVVSGPGGTLWGANAVNGVINVITKSAKDTQGLYASGGGGSFLQDFGAVRYGAGNGSNLFYRAYAQRFDFNNSKLPSGVDAADRWNMNQGGFRVDWEPAQKDVLTLQGDFYGGELDGPVNDSGLDGQNVLGRWTHSFSDESDVRVQMYFDRVSRNMAGSFAKDLKTYDLDVQHRFPLGERQSITWGGGFRYLQDRIRNQGVLAFLPANKTLRLFTAFAQDEITLVEDKLKLTLGTKLEHNDYSGFEYQPSVRLAWTLTARQTIWGAISRSVRTPSRIDVEFYTPPPPVAPGTPNLAGGPGFDSERVMSYELGYRVHPFESLAISIATYYNDYSDLRSLDEPTPNNFIIANHFEGTIYGVEVAVNYHPFEWWRWRFGYNYLNKDLDVNGGLGVNASAREGNDPKHQFTFQSILDLPGNFGFDVTGRWISELSSPVVPAYFSLSTRLSWEYKNFEISVIGHNLTEPSHREFGNREMPRAVYGNITWRF